jgi:hypothetical protein
MRRRPIGQRGVCNYSERRSSPWQPYRHEPSPVLMRIYYIEDSFETVVSRHERQQDLGKRVRHGAPIEARGHGSGEVLILVQYQYPHTKSLGDFLPQQSALINFWKPVGCGSVVFLPLACACAFMVACWTIRCGRLLELFWN